MGLGSWVNDALSAAGKISADIAPYVSHTGNTSPATSQATVQPAGTVPSTVQAATPWYDQPLLVGGIAAGVVALLIGVIVLTRHRK